ncbi:hypothetical protein [Paenibacillus gansuensis]|uniref:Uncharacterized protein n=1 Tax=Paenibacillus gansuensis TaxID=306542 RepID=A0ABW5PBA8_9BACL
MGYYDRSAERTTRTSLQYVERQIGYPVPENFKKAENFGELMLTTAAHLSNHNGIVAAMLQVLQQQK